MNKSCIRKVRKKKLNKPFVLDQDPEELAQYKLIEISNQYNLLNSSQQHNSPESFLKEDLPQRDKNQTQRLRTQGSSTPGRSFRLKSFEIRKPTHMPDLFAQSLLLIQNQFQSRQVFVGKKSALNVTNYTVMDDRFIINKDKTPTLLTSNRAKYPPNIKKVLRRKSTGNALVQSVLLSPSHRLNSPIKIDNALQTNRAKFNFSYVFPKELTRLA